MEQEQTLPVLIPSDLPTAEIRIFTLNKTQLWPAQQKVDRSGGLLLQMFPSCSHPSMKFTLQKFHKENGERDFLHNQTETLK